MTPDFTVEQYGIDTSGRRVYMTRYAWAVREQVLNDPRIKPFRTKVVLIQGGFMDRNGGGALESAGYHDEAGCWDDRSRDLTTAQRDLLVSVYRENGVASWHRDKTHGGFDPHVHNLLGSDRPLASGAARQWQEYLIGQDGLGDHARDYEWRPTPLVTTPPEDDMPAYQDWSQDDKDALAADVARAILSSTVDKDGKVNVKQALNQTRNNAADVEKTIGALPAKVAAALNNTRAGRAK